MSLRCLSGWCSLALLTLPAFAAPRMLRVCSDPNNLPFSNRAGEGFENRIAEILSRDLHAQLEYTWLPQRKSFVEHSLAEHRCDLLIGIPAGMDAVLTTRPYYRSTYVFVSRRSRNLALSSLSDPRLSNWRIGIHVVGDNYAPPAQALARRGLAANLVGYSLFGASGESNPPARLIEAVGKGEVDLGIAWGPLAGYFAAKQTEPLDVVPVSPAVFLAVPFTYDIAMGVRPGEESLKAEMDQVLDRECQAIQALLDEYGVPRPGEEKPSCASSLPSRSALPR